MNVVMCLLAAMLSSGNAEFDQVAREGAEKVALHRVEAQLIERGPGKGRLSEMMLKESARFARAEDAKACCRELYASLLAEILTAEKAKIDLRLGLPQSEGVVELKQARVDEALQKFDSYYAAERQAACETQAQMIAGAVKPTETEVETKNEATLRKEMTDKVAAQQKTPVFEENLKYISETIVDPVIASAKKELKRQSEYLTRTKCDAYAPSVLGKEIEANLRKDVDERRRKASDPSQSWGVFESTLKQTLPEAVEHRVINHVVKMVDDIPVEVEAETILKTIQKDPLAHQKAEESEVLFRGAFAAQVLEGAEAKATAEAPLKEQKEFSEYVRARLASPELVRAVDARIRRDVLPKWRVVRAEVAQTESERLWPTLLNHTWYPSAELADQMAARSDYGVAVKKWRDEPQLVELAQANKGQPLMEETAKHADDSIAVAFDLARSAISAQNALIDEAEPSVLSEAKDRKSSFWRATPDLNAIIGLLTEAVETRWNEKRLTTLWGDGERPANAEEQHTELFPSVKRRIELVARLILEEMEKPEPEPEQKPQPEQPEEPTESDQQSEQEPQMLMYSIVVERKGDEVTVKLEQGKSTVAEKNAKAKMSDYQEAMKYVSDKLGIDILKLK